MRFISFLFLTISLCISSFAKTASESPMAPWGIDADIAPKIPTAATLPKTTIPQKTCRQMIRFFQVYISPIDGPRSSFYPTSSQYALEAIQKYGVLQGIALGCDRLMRENGEMWVYETTDAHGMTRKVDPVR